MVTLGSVNTVRAARWAAVLLFLAPLGAGAQDAEIREALRRLDDRLAALEARVEQNDTSAEGDHLSQEVSTLRSTVSDLSSEVSQQKAQLANLDQGRAGDGLEYVTSKYKVKLYGYVKMDSSYDSQKVQNGNLAFWVLPKSVNGSDDEFSLTANQTRLGLQLGGPDIEGGAINGKLEMDFYGGGAQNKANPRMRLAYVEYNTEKWSVLAGQDWDTLLTVIPNSLNFSYFGYQGRLGYRHPQLRGTYRFDLGNDQRLISKLALSRTIGQDIDGQGVDDGSDAGFPTVQGNLIYELPSPFVSSQKMKVSVSGHYGQEEVDRPGFVGSQNFNTWSVIGSAKVPLTETLAVQGSIWRGENLEEYYGGIGQGINLVKDTGIAAWGGWIQGVWQYRPDWQFNLGAGIDNPDDGDLNAANRSNNYFVAASSYYDIAPGLTVAAEYSYMVTDYLQRASAANHRVHGSVIFKF